MELIQDVFLALLLGLLTLLAVFAVNGRWEQFKQELRSSPDRDRL